MKKITVMMLILILIASFFACAPGTTQLTASQKGLTVDLSQQLNGVWEEILLKPYESIQEQFKQPRSFSWGDGKYLVNSSVFIDLGADPPYITIPGIGHFQVRKAVRMATDRVVLTVSNLVAGSDPADASIELRLYADGTIEIVGPIGHIGISEAYYYRTYGPK